MYFNKFDICEAYTMISIWWNTNGHVWQRPGIDCLLSRIRFQPSPFFSYETMTENGKAILWNAVKRLGLPVHETADKIRLQHYAG